MDTEAAVAALTQEEERLVGEMHAIGRENPEVPGGWEPLPSESAFEPDPLDRAEVVTMREDAAAVLADLNARLTAVRGALNRIKNGSYGRCEVCGKPIELERLAADPAASTCTEHR